MILIDHDECIFCGGCSSVCPASAIELRGTRVATYPEKCIDCGLCVKACPANVIEMFKGIKRVEDLPEEVRKKYNV